MVRGQWASRLVEGSHLPTKRTLDKLGIPRTTFYRWYDRYLSGGPEALADRSPRPSTDLEPHSRAGAREDQEPGSEGKRSVAARNCPCASLIRKSIFVSEASVYRILKSYDLITSPAYVVLSAADEFHDKTTRPNQLWQTDFTYLKVIGWGWFYLLTILDDYSRYIIAWKLCTTMKSGDVTDTLDLALQASGCDQATVLHKPRLLSDNGSSYISRELADWLEDRQMDHVRGAPYHPQTQGKIERWHQTLKNRTLLENYYLPDDLRQQIDAFVDHYNHRRYHENLQNLTPSDVYFGRGQTILKQRERIKRKTLEAR